MERKPESDPLVAAVLAAFPGSEVTRDDRVSGRVQEAGYEKFVTVAPGTKISHTLRLETPCRKCEQCGIVSLSILGTQQDTSLTR